MPKSKTTMKDIAYACKVSLATVSYVLNNSEKEHISHTTRIKVLETARKLNYVPNHASKTLAKQKSNLIGIIINWNKRNSSSKKMIYYDLAGELHRQLVKLGYDTILATTKDLEENADIISKRSLDATFIIDMDTTIVRQVTNNYYVPIIFLDCEINDPLFCKIYPNYSVIITEAKRMLHDNNLFLIMENILNEELKTIITSKFAPEDIYINSPENSLREFLSRQEGKKGIVIGDILGLETERYVDNKNIVVVTSLDDPNLLLPDTKTIAIKNKTKAKAAVLLLERLLRLEYDICIDNKLLLNPDSI
jgi:hypothetical protein